jgi:CheY-like chemotaxis protein
MKHKRKASGSMEILIVEGSPTEVVRLAPLLERRGYSVTAAANGREALALLEQGCKPPMVLLLSKLQSF